MKSDSESDHVRVNIGLPVHRPLSLELLYGAVQLEEAGFDHKDASIPFLENLLRCHSLEHHSTQVVVHDKQRWQRVHSPREEVEWNHTGVPLK